MFAELSTGLAKRFWRELEEAVAAADALSEADWPEPLEPPLLQRQAELVKKLRAVARERAQVLDIAEELLGRRRDVEACFRHYLAHGELDRLYQGWRYDLVGADFERILEGAV